MKPIEPFEEMLYYMILLTKTDKEVK